MCLSLATAERWKVSKYTGEKILYAQFKFLSKLYTKTLIPSKMKDISSSCVSNNNDESRQRLKKSRLLELLIY